MNGQDIAARLTAWLEEQLPHAMDVRVEGLDRIEVGHSAEMVLLTVVARSDRGEERQDVVVRLRPPLPGLLEPYDLRRQYDILRALEPTPVRAPRALWIDESGDVLGRPFYVMERLPGEVYEREIPAALHAAPDRVRRMARNVIDQIAAIHLVDLAAAGLDRLGDGRDYLDEELAHWRGEVERVRRGPLPALERLADELARQRPDPSPQVTLVHGDTKGGNFAFVDDEVTGVFDWEMATVGDPMADIGWAEVTWRMTLPFSMLADDEVDELLTHYETASGIAVHDRAWHRAMQAYKMTVIMLVGSMLFDAGHSDDPRFAEMGHAVPYLTTLALHELGVTEDLEHGPVTPREERLHGMRRDPPSGVVRGASR